MTVPAGGGPAAEVSPLPVAVTVAVNVVLPVARMPVGFAESVVVLANNGVAVFQLFTRLAMFGLPKPVAASYPRLVG